MCLNLLKEEWDVAIILDACRYDTFKKYYKRFFPNGKLEKRLGASHTIEWIIRNFYGKKLKEVVYISGNPLINSLNKSPIWKWTPTRVFYKVYDCWKDCWNGEIGTTDPKKLAIFAKNLILSEKKKRIIVHFMQPHMPYRKKKLNIFEKENSQSYTKFAKIKQLIDYLLIKYRVFGMSYASLSRYLKRDESVQAHFIKEIGILKAKQLYEDNLVWALTYVKEMIKGIDKKIVITSDHGEAFGEGGYYSHDYLTNEASVRIVPFFYLTTNL